MATESITISTDEYTRLKKKARIADDALVQLACSFEDLRNGRVHAFKGAANRKANRPSA